MKRGERMEHKLNKQIMKVAILYLNCTDKALKKSVGQIIAGDYGTRHKPPGRVASR